MALFQLMCRHAWGFPRRWREFQGRLNVDIQTCANCGAHRVSIVQFGPVQGEAAPISQEEAC